MAWMAAQGVHWELVVDKLFDPENFDPDETYTLPPGGAMREWASMFCGMPS